MTPGELLEFIASDCGHVYEGRGWDTEHMPMAFLLCGDGVTIVAMAVPPELYRPTLEAIARSGADAIGFVCEAWAAKARPGEVGGLERRVREAGGVSQLPPDDRYEVLQIEVLASDGQRLSLFRTITRGGGKVMLGEAVLTNQGWSRFLSDLPWRKP